MSPLREILEKGIETGAFPGAVLRVHKRGEWREEIAVGTLDGAQKVESDTFYDLASLTKIITLAVALRAFRAAKIPLCTPLCEFLPAFDARFTLENLMRHKGGLETHLQTLHDTPVGEWLEVLAAQSPRTPPRVFYNCSNFFLLARAVEALESALFSVSLDKHLAAPAGLQFFSAPSPERVAPTEFGFRGTIHDEAARAHFEQTGDVCGNAGLFADAANVARFGDLWREEAEFFHPDDLRAISQNALREGSSFRGLGWQIGARYCLGESKNSARVWSHLGFTGPLLAFDPASQTTLVILCNRVFPNRVGPDRFPFFKAIGEAVFG